MIMLGYNVSWVRGALAMVYILTLIIGAGCSAKREVIPLSWPFGLKKHGSDGPHARYTVSLVKQDQSGEWRTIWHAISARCEGISSWNDRIVFGAVTRNEQENNGTVRLLFFSDNTGVVDITSGIARLARVDAQISPQLIVLQREASTLNIVLHDKGAITTRVALSDIETIVSSIVAQGTVRDFDGNTIRESN
jgi:hypothetical protein